jgi:hypothetical protein
MAASNWLMSGAGDLDARQPRQRSGNGPVYAVSETVSASPSITTGFSQVELAQRKRRARGSLLAQRARMVTRRARHQAH